MRDYLVQLKAEVRNIVHDIMASSAEYVAPGIPTPKAVPLGVRFHTKIQAFGDAGSTGYAEFIEGITRLVFNREELDRLGVNLKANGFIMLTHPEWRNAKFRLDAREPFEGPVEEVWHVVYVR